MAKVLVLWTTIGKGRMGEVWPIEIVTNKVSLLKKFHEKYIAHPETPKLLSKKIAKFFFKKSGKPVHNNRVFRKPRSCRYDLVVITGQYIRRK